MNQLAGLITESQARKMMEVLDENEDNALSPKMQKQFNMIVSALKKAKSEKDIDQVHTDLMLLPKKLTKIFINKLVNMGLAEKEGDEQYSLSYDDGLDEAKKMMQILNEERKLIYIGQDELEKMAFSAISAYNKKNGLDPIQSVRINSSGNSYDDNEAVTAGVTVKTNTGEEMRYRLAWDKDLNLSELIPPYKDSDISQSNKKQKTGSSKPIILTPLQKKEFLSAVRDLKRVEDLEYALGEAGNILANILTNGEAEYIEDVEDFGYDPDEVENYAMDLASSKR